MKSGQLVFRLSDSFVALISILCMLGWVFEVRMMVSVIDGFPSMKFNTALCLLLLTLVPYQLEQANRYKYTALICSLLALAISSLTLLQDLFQTSFGIDQLIVKDPWSSSLGYAVPGRMSAATSIAFMMLSLAFILLSQQHTRKLAQYLLPILTFLSFISLLAYLFAIPIKSRQSLFISMSLNTSLGLFLLSLRTSSLQPSLLLSGFFTGDLMGHKMARVLFPTMTFTSILLCYIMIEGITNAIISPEFGAVFYAGCFIVIGFLLIRISANRLNEIDLARVKEINERKKAQTWSSTLIEASPAAMMVVNKQGLIIQVNKQVEILFGYNTNELINQPVKMLIPEETKQIHPSYLDSYFLNPTSRPMRIGRDLYGLKKDQTRVPLEIGLNPVKSENQTFVLASISDITERKKKEKAEEKNLELIIRQRELEQFNYIASHDLQEPLRTVSNYITVLKEDESPHLSEAANKHLEAIQKATQRMFVLVKALLEYSKLDKDINKEEKNTEIILQEVLTDLDSLISFNKVKIKYDPLPTLKVYPVEFRQLLQNLISNAIKFRRTDVTPEIEILCAEDGTYWKFCVRDNGIGICQKHYERVFTMFQRLHLQNEYQGHGIGLANCRKIVIMHGGQIWVESVLGEGSSFYFTIPKND